MSYELEFLEEALDGQLLVLAIAVGRRDRNAVYRLAESR